MFKLKCADRHGYLCVTSITLPIASSTSCHPHSSSGGSNDFDSQEIQLTAGLLALEDY